LAIFLSKFLERLKIDIYMWNYKNKFGDN